MQPTESELATKFESFEDEQLLALSDGSDELTELALSVLKVELSRRGLQPVFPVRCGSNEQRKPSHLDEQRVVTVRRFDSLPEAMAARAALEAAGIECFLRDENAVRTMWHLSNLLGGTRLDVLEHDREKAEAVLLRTDAAEADVPPDYNDEFVENKYVCLKCGSWDVNRVTPLGGLATLAGWIAGRRIQADEQQWQCNVCKAIWIDNDRD